MAEIISHAVVAGRSTDSLSASRDVEDLLAPAGITVTQ